MSDLDQLAVNTIRTLAMDAVQEANSGHPGTPMALAPLAWVLYTRHLAHNPGDPSWVNRDRFVLSAGHASMLQYATLHLTGYDLPLEELRSFRQLHSKTPGHPESFVGTPGVETTTGPLGQGLGNAVGFALAEQMLAARFNKPGHEIIDHRTWVITSDGDLMEGVGSEAASLAGQLGLAKLVVFYDDNHITIDGSTDKSFDAEDKVARFAAYGWRTLEVDDVNDLGELDRVLKEAAQSDGRPTFVRVPSIIGYPAPNAQNTAKAHGSPLGAEEVDAAKRVMGWDHPQFFVPEDVYHHADQHERGAALQQEWQARYDAWREAFPDDAAELERRLSGRLPDGWADDLPAFPIGEKEATRKSSNKAIQHFAARIPELVGGSADLHESNLTLIKDSGLVQPGDYDQRNLEFGVREHAMASVCNGLVLHGGLRPYCATFLIFTDYCRPAIRLAALMGLPVIYVMTHDSIGLGEDGPTHQPVEHLAALRAIPNLVVLRPADANETFGAWREAIARTDGPSLLALTRQGVPVLEGSAAAEVARGAYVVRPDDANPDIAIVATGSEVSLAVEAAALLAEQDVSARVVSMPSWELFEEQDDDYLSQVLPDDVPVLSVEAGSSFGWAAWADASVAIDEFGASAPGPEVMAHFGFTPEHVAEVARQLVDDFQEE